MPLLQIDDRAENFNKHAKLAGWTVQCDRTLSFRRPELIALCELWQEKARTYGVPPRSAFDARSMKPFIRNLSIVERVPIDDATWRYRMRLYSSALSQLIGGKSGDFVEDIAPPRHVVQWMACYDTVLDRPRPLRFVNHYEREEVNYLVGESFCAPLGDDPGRPDMILSCLYVSSRKAMAGS